MLTLTFSSLPVTMRDQERIGPRHPVDVEFADGSRSSVPADLVMIERMG